jgi:serine/threonine protein kinase
MFRDLRTATIKVIDFGLSGWTGQKRLTYVQSLPYRSPEVMLRLPYGVPIDMWSLGCIMVEMHTRVPLFVGTDELNQMQKVVEILGAIPDIMLEASNEQIRSHFFARSVSSSGSPTWSVRQPTVLQSSVTKSLLDAVDPTASPTASFGEESDQIVHNPDPKASLAKLITARSSKRSRRLTLM